MNKTSADSDVLMEVKIWLKETSQPLKKQAKVTYQKGDFYVVILEGNIVEKYPIGNIWRVSETY